MEDDPDSGWQLIDREEDTRGRTTDLTFRLDVPGGALYRHRYIAQRASGDGGRLVEVFGEAMVFVPSPH